MYVSAVICFILAVVFSWKASRFSEKFKSHVHSMGQAYNLFEYKSYKTQMRVCALGWAFFISASIYCYYKLCTTVGGL